MKHARVLRRPPPLALGVPAGLLASTRPYPCPRLHPYPLPRHHSHRTTRNARTFRHLLRLPLARDLSAAFFLGRGRVPSKGAILTLQPDRGSSVMIFFPPLSSQACNTTPLFAFDGEEPSGVSQMPSLDCIPVTLNASLRAFG